MYENDEIVENAAEEVFQDETFLDAFGFTVLFAINEKTPTCSRILIPIVKNIRYAKIVAIALNPLAMA